MSNLSLSGKQWQKIHFDENLKKSIQEKYDFCDVLSTLLAEKEIPLDKVEDFLNPKLKNSLPDPDHLKDMEHATRFLADIIRNGGKIGILADFDVDGATSAATLINFFKLFEIETFIHIPDRIKEGYGPNIEALNTLFEKGSDVIIVLDCGTTNIELFQGFTSCSIIIIDHHVAKEERPGVMALINPNRKDESSALTNLCTAGLAFLTLVSLNRKLRDLNFYQTRNEPNLLDFLDLVALGTVCDIMTLVGLNRAFVGQGLKVLNQRKNIGIKSLLDFLKIQDALSTYHLGFIIGPRINAGGRLGDATVGVRLLTTDSPDEALSISAELDHLNHQRQMIEKQMLEDAIRFAQIKESKKVLVIADQNFHQGVIGIIAGRIKDQFHKPAVVISCGENGYAKGSARSIHGFNIGEIFHKATQEGIILGGGGHHAAAGCTLLATQIDAFENFLEKEFDTLFGDTQIEKILHYSASIHIKDATHVLIEAIEKCAPFGMGNPKPRFLINRCYILWYSILSGGHLKLTLKLNDEETLEAIAFRVEGTPLENLYKLPNDQALQFIGTLQVDTFVPSNPKIKLMIEDARLADV